MLACNLVFKLAPKKKKIMVSLADTKKFISQPYGAKPKYLISYI